MAEKFELKVGSQVSFKYRGITYGTVVKVNPKKALVQFDGDKLIRVPYSMLKIENKQVIQKVVLPRISIPKFTFEKSNIKTNHDLKELLEEVKVEYNHVFESIFNGFEKNQLKTVLIGFGSRITYRNCGWYRRRENRINISASFKQIPREITKCVIYHELLHIHFNGHPSSFRIYERKFKDYHACDEFIGKLMKDIRINGTNYLNFRSEPTKQETKKPIKKPSSSKPKTNPKPVVKVEESDIDRRWRLIQEKKKRQNQELHR